MSGRVKAKEYDVEDSNVEMIGSQEDRDLRKDAAAYEPAWIAVGTKPGLQIWRIVQFKVVAWPKEDYGEFFRGDSYIILRTYKEPDNEKLSYDLHFWLGKESTQDEMGTAAYKTVELDTLLNDIPVQYREVEGCESAKFKQYFESVTYLEGGADSGFRHVEDVIPPPKMYVVSGLKKSDICITEINKPCWSALSIHNAFVFVVDSTIIRFYGSKCNKFERWDANAYTAKIKSSFKFKACKFDSTDIIIGDDDIIRMIEYYRERKSQEEDEAAEQAQLPEDDDEELSEEEQQSRRIFEKLLKVLGDPPEDYDLKTNPETFPKTTQVPCEEDFVKKLVCVHHNRKTARIEMEVMAEGENISEDMINDERVFILDNGKELFCWAGKKVDKKDKNSQMVYCCNYLKDKVNKNAPVSMVKNLDRFKEKLRR